VMSRATGLQVGGLLTSAPVTGLPYGLFERIAAITGEKGALRVSLKSVSLGDAFQELSVSFGGADLPPAATVAQELVPAHAASLSSGGSLSLKPFGPHSPLSCGAGRSVSLDGGVTLIPKPSGYIHISPFGGTVIDLRMAADIVASLDYDTSTSFSCSLDVKLGNGITIGEIIIPIGPIDVPLAVSLVGRLTGTLSGDGQDEGGASETIHLVGGIHYQNGRLTPIASATHTNTITLPSFSGTTASVEILLNGGLGLGLPPGPPLQDPFFTLTAGIGPRLTYGGCPLWTLDGEFTADADLDIAHVVSASLNLLTLSWPITSQVCGGGGQGGGGSGPGSGGAPTVTVTNPGSQTGAVGTPVSLQIHASDSDAGTLSYNASGLPSELSINNATGLITGTPTAGGIYTVVIAAADASGPSSSATFTWKITSIASWVEHPAAAQGMSAVSCVSSTMCMGVGSTPNNVMLAELWNGSSWSVEPTPAPSTSHSAFISVSCTATTACVAIGEDGNNPISEIWNGLTWTVEPVAVAGASYTDLFSVSCWAPSSCIVVGATDAYDTPGHSHPLVEYWDGSTWTVQAAADPNPPGPNDGSSTLYGIDCTGASFCVAVGQHQGATYPTVLYDTLAETWDGTSWTLNATPDGTNSYDNQLSGVSCSASNACTAVGNYTVGASGVTSQQPLVQRWNGSTWTSQSVPVPSNTFNLLYADSCTAASSCWTVGAVSGPGGSAGGPYGASWDGNTWTADSPPAASDGSVPLDISCISYNYCVAVGYTDSDVFS
jgi:hypothetical protein